MTEPVSDDAWRELLDGRSDETARLGVLWGKSASRAGGTVNLLLQHLFDAMAVAHEIWDNFLAPQVQSTFDATMEGDGRRLYAWLCGLHDVGKATPAFQRQVPDLFAKVKASGLETPSGAEAQGVWRHERASALILREAVRGAWPDEVLDWVWPLLAGHHGTFPDLSETAFVKSPSRRRALHGDASWTAVQHLLVQIVTRASGWPDVADACVYSVPHEYRKEVVWVRDEASEVVVTAVTDDGAAEIARHERTTPGNPSYVDEHFGPAPEGPLDRTPSPRTATERGVPFDRRRGGPVAHRGRISGYG